MGQVLGFGTNRSHSTNSGRCQLSVEQRAPSWAEGTILGAEVQLLIKVSWGTLTLFRETLKGPTELQLGSPEPWAGEVPYGLGHCHS